MIIKELNEVSLEDKFVKVGRVAEEQIVYYSTTYVEPSQTIKIFMSSITCVSNRNRMRRRSII
jgi:hypothetical protein